MLLINDGSKKDYSHLEKEYSQDKRIKFFTQENLGVSAARNKGIEIASGKYIVFTMRMILLKIIFFIL